MQNIASRWLLRAQGHKALEQSSIRKSAQCFFLRADYVTVQDYPMRGRPVYLHMRKNKWWDKKTNEIFSYNLELPNEEGTRLSAEFVAFLKDEGGDNGSVD